MSRRIKGVQDKKAISKRKVAATKEQLQSELHRFLDLMEQEQFIAECADAKDLVQDIRMLLNRPKEIQFTGGTITLYLNEDLIDESYDVLYSNLEVVVKHKGKEISNTIDTIDVDFDE